MLKFNLAVRKISVRGVFGTSCQSALYEKRVVACSLEENVANFLWY